MEETVAPDVAPFERVAQEAPLPCYGVEFRISDPRCVECPHQKGCITQMGRRADMLTLDKIEFKLVPKKFDLPDVNEMVDPETPHVERIYIICHQTVFGKRPQDKIGQHKNSLVKNARAAKSSLRMFMLACMVGHLTDRKLAIEHNADYVQKEKFTARRLSLGSAVKTVEMYRKICQREYGSFDISSLDMVVDGSYADNDLERQMLQSEIAAGKQVIGYKLVSGGPPERSLYSTSELSLDPHWLATETTYEKTVFAEHINGVRGTQMENRHRYAVVQVKQAMKRRKDFAIGVFQTRERVMARAVKSVLYHFGHQPHDFEIVNEPVTNVMELWVFIARAMQHWHCLRYLDGERSLFKSRDSVLR